MPSAGRSIVLVLFALGCSSGPVENHERPPKEYQQLKGIGEAYIQSIKKQKRGPHDLAELKPFLLRQPEGQELFNAVSSGNYVVIWGLSLKNLEAGKGQTTFPIMAYQASEDENGKRYVLMHGTQVQQLTEEEFKNATFAGPR